MGCMQSSRRSQAEKNARQASRVAQLVELTDSGYESGSTDLVREQTMFRRSAAPSPDFND